jgi:hypothetical protein
MHVVVVAYGARAVTRRAIGRIRGWGSVASSISVVPASPAVDLAPGAFDAVHIITTEGTAGVRQAAGSDPVLVLHDDVRLDAAGARELIARLDTTALVGAVDSGSLLGFACFAARSIVRLSTSIVIPGTQPAPDTPMMSNVDVHAPHDHSCRAQLVEDQLDPERPLIVASMIVKDEEERLPAALASVAGLVDRIDICDTGSTDATLNVIRRYGGRVREIEWRNDFSWARNEALSMCHDATFALQLDADERVVVADPTAFRRWVRTWSHEFDALSIELMNEREDGATSTIHPIRIARPASSRFEGAVHEVVNVQRSDGQAGRIAATGEISLLHIGYRSEIVDSRNKLQRNIDIARSAHLTDPSAKTAIDLARSLLAVDENDPEATTLLETASEQLDSETSASGHSFVLAARSRQEYRGGNLDRALRLAMSALEHLPNEDLALVTAATALLELDRPEDLVRLADEVARRPAGIPLYAVPRNTTRYRAMVGLAYGRTGQPETAGDRLTDVMIADAAGVADIVASAVPLLIEAGIDASRLTSMVAHDVTGQVTRALATHIPPATLASVCLAGLILGSAPAPVVAIQLTAALVAGLDDLAVAGLEFADILDGETRARLVGLATRKQHHHFASQLAALATPAPVA